MNTKDLYKIIVEQKAKIMAWDDLDDHDRRVYLAEAEKAFHKEQRSFAKELAEDVKKVMDDPNYVSRADDYVYLKKQPKTPKTPKKKAKKKSK